MLCVTSILAVIVISNDLNRKTGLPDVQNVTERDIARAENGFQRATH